MYLEDLVEVTMRNVRIKTKKELSEELVSISPGLSKYSPGYVRSMLSLGGDISNIEIKYEIVEALKKLRSEK